MALGIAITVLMLPHVGVAQETTLVDTRAVVSVPSANLRSQPSTAAAVVGRVVRGDSVRVLEARPNGWTRVRWGTRDAWLRGAFLQRVGPSASAPTREPPALPSASAAPAAIPDSAEDARAPTSLARTPESGTDVDPRLAGRGNAARSARSTVPASRDESRLGVMLGIATGPFQTFSLNGPAARVYVRRRITASPIAGRLDLEVSRMTARDLAPSSFRVVDARVTGGMEYGVPVTRQLELAVVGSLGVARRSTELKVDLGDPQSNVSVSNSEWSLAYDVGLGAKLGRRLYAAFHFFSSDGAPYRLYVGART